MVAFGLSVPSPQNCVKAAKGFVSQNLPGAQQNRPGTSAAVLNAEDLFSQPSVSPKSDLLIIEPTRWYQLYPYEIVVYDAKNNFEFVYALPIPPEALSLHVVAASESFATIGGVVEQTSENVFTNIMLSGTTGIAVNRADSQTPAKGDEFRAVSRASGAISGAIDSLANTIQSVADAASDFSTEDLVGGLGTLMANKLWFKRSAVSSQKNGYYEILTLHKFLQAYSTAKEEDPLNYSLYFRTHKENLEYRVVMKDFRVMKSKESPYLYRYQIVFKGWSQRSPLRQIKDGSDRFGKDGDLNMTNTLTATGAVQKVRSLVNTLRRGPAAVVDTLLQVRPIF